MGTPIRLLPGLRETLRRHYGKIAVSLVKMGLAARGEGGTRRRRYRRLHGLIERAPWPNSIGLNATPHSQRLQPGRRTLAPEHGRRSGVS
jgi:hypothetical protein